MLQGKVSSEVLSKRQQYINGMKKFVEDQKAKLQSALEKLGLDLPNVLQTESKQVCPYNKHHVVPEKIFKKHCEVCKLLSAGYQKDEVEAQLQDLDFAYKDTDSVLKVEIDENSLNKIIWDSCVQNGQVYTGHRRMPQSHIEENIDLTPEDRLAVYHHVVKKSYEAGKVLPVDRFDDLLTTDWGSLVKKGLLDEQNNKEYGSKLEQLAALRDMKRRRQSYRAKNVHITKKSYTEIIREVIVNQMEILAPERQGKEAERGREPQPDDRVDLSRDKQAEEDRSQRPRHGKDGKRSSWKERDDGRRRRDRRDHRRSRSREGRHRDSSSKSGSRSYDQPRQSRAPDSLRMDAEVKVEAEDDYGEGSFHGSTKHGDREESLEPGEYRPSRKRSQSLSDSNSSDGKSRKSKKSKHRKKHSKKHKRKD